MAGSKNSVEDIRKKACSACEELARQNRICECEFYTTKGKLDATDFVRNYIENTDEDVCFIACGGDGTVGEVAAGCIGHDNAYMSVYPCGSGNDYVRYYGGKKAFLDVSGIFEGSVRDVDIMKIGNRYSLNICNFGFDTAVVKTMEKVKRVPIVGGNNSYYTGILTALFTAMRNHCKVYADGELLNSDGRLLLCTLSNGSYVGGGFNCAPKSDNTDGLIEVCLAEPISVPKFISLLPYYEAGTHLDNEKFSTFMKYRRAKSVRLVSDRSINVCIDGELIRATDVTVENIHKAIHFVVARDAIIAPAKNPSLVK